MACQAGAIAEAIVADLNGESFGQGFTAVRRWIAHWQLTELGTLRVTIVPGPATFEPLDRRRDDERHAMDIVVQKKINPDLLAQVDDLVALLEEFVTHYRAKNLTAGSKGIHCSKRELVPATAAAVSQENLEEWRAFTGVVRTTWTLRQ